MSSLLLSKTPPILQYSSNPIERAIGYQQRNKQHSDDLAKTYSDRLKITPLCQTFKPKFDKLAQLPQDDRWYNFEMVRFE